MTGDCLFQSESETGSGRKLESKSIVCFILCSSGIQVNEGTHLSIVGNRRFSSVDNDLYSLLSKRMGVCNIKGPVSIKEEVMSSESKISDEAVILHGLKFGLKRFTKIT